MQHFHECRVAVVDNSAVADVHFCDSIHFLLRKLKIPDIHISLHALADTDMQNRRFT